MYNIDLSFLKSKDKSSELTEKFNKQFQFNIGSKLCTKGSNRTNCSHCFDNYKSYIPYDERNIIEAHCNGILGATYCEIKTDNGDWFKSEDLCIVKYKDYLEIIKVIESGEIVRLRRQRNGLFGEELPQVIRSVDENDLATYERNLNDEERGRDIFKIKVEKFGLIMKLVDVHYQFDRKRLFFFYTSDGRVDFRELAKDLASEFRTRIELRQIGVRDEAKRVGGLGVCGREYCCSSFMNNFKRITTQIAAEQNITSNLSKLSGPCGKLKCCLSFECE